MYLNYLPNPQNKTFNALDPKSSTLGNVTGNQDVGVDDLNLEYLYDGRPFKTSVQTTVSPRKLEHGFRRISARLGSLILYLKGMNVPTFWLLLYMTWVHGHLV